MNVRKQIEILFILMFANLKIFKSEYFKHNTKTLNIIRQQSSNLNCIHVNLDNLNGLVFSFVLNIQIPLVISNGLSTTETQAQTSLCPNLIVELQTIGKLETIFDNYVTNRGIIFILLSEKIDWHKIYIHSTKYWQKHSIYNVFYINAEHSTFYHPFIRRNEKYGAIVDTTKYNIKDIFKNLHGYPIRVDIFNSVFSKVKSERGTSNITKAVGVDAKVACLLEKIFNFTMQLHVPYNDLFGARLENGSFSGALGRIIRYETDLTMTGFFVKDYLTRDIHFSVSVYMDQLCCYVIKSKRIPESILPLYSVNENIWIVYMSVGFFLSCVWMLLRRANLYIDRYARDQETNSAQAICVQYLHIFADTWSLWVRMIITRFPPYNAERIFAISLCLVSVIIGALFDSSLATVYIHPRYYKDINTLDELEKANLKIFIKHAAMYDDLFRDQNSRLYNSLDKRLMLVGEQEERLINIMSKRGGFAVVTREFSLLIGDIYYIITKKIHIIPDCPKTYHIAYLYTRNSPYEETFNVALLRFLAAGIIDQWIELRRHEVQCQVHKYYDFIAENGHQLRAFQIIDIQLAIYILVFGNSCAVLLFLAEVVIHRHLHMYVVRKVKI